MQDYHDLLGWEALDWSYSMLQVASFGPLMYVLLSFPFPC